MQTNNPSTDSQRKAQASKTAQRDESKQDQSAHASDPKKDTSQLPTPGGQPRDVQGESQGQGHDRDQGRDQDRGDYKDKDLPSRMPERKTPGTQDDQQHAWPDTKPAAPAKHDDDKR